MTWTRGALYAPSGATISPWSLSSIGASIRAMGGAAPASAAWPLANLALLIPFGVDEPVNIQKVWYQTGTLTGGNLDIGVYDEAFARKFSSGATARAGASILTYVDTTDYTLAPGRYYLAMSADGTATYFAWAGAAGLCAALGVLEATASYPLPATITPAITTRAYIPHFGLMLNAGYV